MKRAALIIGLLFWVVTSISVLAQESTERKTVPLPILIDCGSVEEISIILKDFQEMPVAQGKAVWKIPNGQYLEGPMTIWINPTTLTFSITIQPSEETACIILPGAGFTPYNTGTKT